MFSASRKGHTESGSTSITVKASHPQLLEVICRKHLGVGSQVPGDNNSCALLLTNDTAFVCHHKSKPCYTLGACLPVSARSICQPSERLRTYNAAILHHDREIMSASRLLERSSGSASYCDVWLQPAATAIARAPLCPKPTSLMPHLDVKHPYVFSPVLPVPHIHELAGHQSTHCLMKICERSPWIE